MENDDDFEIDLQWFADDDDDTDEAAAEQAEATAEATAEDDDDPFGFDDWQEVEGHNDIENDPDAPEGGYNSAWGTDENGNETYTDYFGNTTQVGWDSDSDDDYNWEFKNPNSVGYEGYTDKNGNWHDSISLHNAGKAAQDFAHNVAGWWESTADKINRNFGGAREGLTNADFERVEEAEKARAVYQGKADETKTAIDNLKSSKTYDPEKDAETLAKLEAEYTDWLTRAESINRDFNQTDTGSRAHNMLNNALEDLGDVGTRVNQFFGGSDEYGLGAHGQVNDRNGDGKTSITERMMNMGRDVATWGKDKLLNGSIQLGMSALPGGPLVAALAGPSIKTAIDKGVDKLSTYAKTHPLTANDKEAIAKQQEWDLEHQSDSEDTPVSERQIQDKTPSVAKVTETPKWADWNTKTLGAMASNGHSFGWNKTNDVMGHSTMALSDAHFKDFMLATMIDNPTMQLVVKSKLMMDYFS